MTNEQLAALDAAATQGVWEAETGKRIDPCITVNGDVIAAYSHCYPECSIPIEEGDAILITALVNGYRAGQLVVRTEPSEADVERVNEQEWRSGLAIGDRVEKVKGSCWTGRVVGFYRTELTPYGVCVESEREPGSVQIYPEAALKIMWCDEEPRAAIAAMVR